jgi:hypothetical protein
MTNFQKDNGRKSTIQQKETITLFFVELQKKEKRMDKQNTHCHMLK